MVLLVLIAQLLDPLPHLALEDSLPSGLLVLREASNFNCEIRGSHFRLIDFLADLGFVPALKPEEEEEHQDHEHVNSDKDETHILL